MLRSSEFYSDTFQQLSSPHRISFARTPMTTQHAGRALARPARERSPSTHRILACPLSTSPSLSHTVTVGPPHPKKSVDTP
jgi:hypothetical protein